MTNSGMIFDIKRFAIHDGPGIRTTVFLKGCPLSCRWCHNPEGISPEREIMFFEYSCICCRACAAVCPAGAITFTGSLHRLERQKCRGCAACSGACPTGALKAVGRVISVAELIEEIEKDLLLFDNTDGGVTFSGGEPLFQHRFLMEALQKCKEGLLHTALDTSGYAPASIFASLIDYVDLFLFDLKPSTDEVHRKYTGVSNKLIRRNLEALVDAGRGGDVILRFPVIPGITDTEKNIEELLQFAASLKGIGQIDLLPFHDVNEKYCRLGRDYQMPARGAPAPEDLKRIKDIFEKAGFTVVF